MRSNASEKKWSKGNSSVERETESECWQRAYCTSANKMCDFSTSSHSLCSGVQCSLHILFNYCHKPRDARARITFCR